MPIRPNPPQPRDPWRFLRRLAPLFVSGLLFACGGGVADLETMDGSETATVRSNGVALTAVVDEWPGDVPIERAVTPVRVMIHNDNPRPILLRYSRFELLEPRTGDRYAALTPLTVDGSVRQPVQDAGFEYDEQDIAPHYADYDPVMGSGPTVFVHDELYYDKWFRRWAEVDLPTPEMLQRALPEGKVRSGDFIDGWLFFEQVDDDADSVMLMVELVDADTRRLIDTVRIPFDVD